MNWQGRWTNRDGVKGECAQEEQIQKSQKTAMVRQNLMFYYGIQLPLNPTTKDILDKARMYQAIGAHSCARVCAEAAVSLLK